LDCCTVKKEDSLPSEAIICLEGKHCMVVLFIRYRNRPLGSFPNGTQTPAVPETSESVILFIFLSSLGELGLEESLRRSAIPLFVQS